MALKITEQTITSDATNHTARVGPDGWHLSWCPEVTLTGNAAVSGMLIAQAAARGVRPGDPIWPHLGIWAHELGMRTSEAVELAAAGIHEKELGH